MISVKTKLSPKVLEFLTSTVDNFFFSILLAIKPSFTKTENLHFTEFLSILFSTASIYLKQLLWKCKFSWLLIIRFVDVFLLAGSNLRLNGNGSSWNSKCEYSFNKLRNKHFAVQCTLSNQNTKNHTCLRAEDLGDWDILDDQKS